MFSLLSKRYLPSFFEFEGVKYPIKWKKYNSSKRLKLLFCVETQSIKVTYPPYISSNQLNSFLKASDSFLQKTIKESPTPTPFIFGNKIPIFGNDTMISAISHKASMWAWDEGGHLLIPQKKNINTHVIGALKSISHEFFSKYSKKLCLELNIDSPKMVKIHDPKTFWGSCNSHRILSYSWRLSLSPLEVAKYVCAHEVAHLVEPNHSKKFWLLVERLHPRFNEDRKWLKSHGLLLRAYGLEGK